MDPITSNRAREKTVRNMRIFPHPVKFSCINRTIQVQLFEITHHGFVTSNIDFSFFGFFNAPIRPYAIEIANKFTSDAPRQSCNISDTGNLSFTVCPDTKHELSSSEFEALVSSSVDKISPYLTEFCDPSP